MSPDGDGVANGTFDDPEAIFVLGAICDTGNCLKGKSRLKADLQGIASARLPLRENLDLGDQAPVLVCNQVLEIMRQRRAGADWRSALLGKDAVPSRKIAKH
eukprot:TRINITY_DN26106_c0_g1_i2.p1 TRINITY_DN26106_c0_g1~~TRINITY_DN26106_c0_g1_i2.p1  ORF type:complete len:102 (+),score=29.21 TRINITY_DN26106_c0_g1_i2:333-638(+)